MKLLQARERGTPETNANGERIIKKSELGETQYVSANYIVRNKTVISKHVFAGNQRIASTVSMKNNCGTVSEKNTMYFHPDHLGSSSYVTDKKGNFFEMIEYLPYGETLYDEAATVDKTEFRFTSKEQDAETGLYYHGARYRDAKTGVWLSVDPYLENYLEGEPASGVFNPININLYHYAGNNPIKYVDPDGNYFLTPNADGTYNFNAEIKNGFGKRISRCFKLNIPILGSIIYDSFLNDNNYYDLNEERLTKASKGLRLVGKINLLRHMTNKLRPVANFGRGLNIAGWVLTGTDLVLNDGSVISKAELAVEASGIFSGMEKEFIDENVQGVLNQVNDSINAGEIFVNAFKKDDELKFSVEQVDSAPLDRINEKIKTEYEQWKTSWDYKE